VRIFTSHLLEVNVSLSVWDLKIRHALSACHTRRSESRSAACIINKKKVRKRTNMQLTGLLVII